jgi:putative ABC transport system permease protein
MAGATSLARRNLLQDKTRLALSAAGVALAVLLILLLNGLLAGIYRQVTAYADHAPGSLIVAQTGVANLLGATSLLPPGTLETVRAVDGVEDAVPILSQFVILDLHGQKQPAYLVGYDPARGGGPWRLAAGRQPAADDEIVFDRVLAERHALALGEQVELIGRRFTIVGLSDETTSWMTSFLFIRQSAAQSLLRAPGATSFLLVTLAPGVPAEEVRRRLNALPGLNAIDKDTLRANDARLFARFFSLPLQLMVGIAFLVGTLIVGLVSYTAIVERQREYGVLKALGARNRVLYFVVTAQTLLTAVGGAAAGVALAFGAGQLIMRVRPQFLVAFEPSAIAWALLAGLAMALLAALIPARTIAGLAPADVFRK